MSQRDIDPREYNKQQHQEGEVSHAQNRAQDRAHSEGPLVDLRGGGGREILEKLTDLDLESEEYEDLEALIQPFLPQSQMLADHDDYYDSLSRELLNENQAERVIFGRERGRLLTGPFLEVALDVEHDGGGPSRTPLGPAQKEALRTALVDARTDRQSLEGTLLEALTEMHVSSEVHRNTEEQPENDNGLLSMFPGL
jgi:hypothetical protein